MRLGDERARLAVDLREELGLAVELRRGAGAIGRKVPRPPPAGGAEEEKVAATAAGSSWSRKAGPGETGRARNWRATFAGSGDGGSDGSSDGGSDASPPGT